MTGSYMRRSTAEQVGQAKAGRLPWHGKTTGREENLVYLVPPAPGRFGLSRAATAIVFTLAALGVGLLAAVSVGRLGPESWRLALAAIGGAFAGALLVSIWYAGRLKAAWAAAEGYRSRLANAERSQALWISLSAVLHDVRNPLHNITLLIETLGTPASNPIQIRKQVLDELERIHVRMRRVMAQVAEFSGEIERRPVSLRDVLREVEAMVLPLARESGVALSLQCPSQVNVVTDPKYLIQAVDHLLLNCMQILTRQPAGRPRRLSVLTESGDGDVSLFVEDSGPGLPEEIRENPFEPLAASQPTGMGLGLTIAHALAQSAGGELSVARTDASGTRFQLRLKTS